MKKIILCIISLVIAVSLTGCMGAGGTQLQGINTADGVGIDKIDASKYKNDLDGLEKYLTALRYLPKDSEPTEMMYNVIGAKDGDRYNFTVDNSTVFVELYEYDTDNLNEDANRVIREVKEKGEFKVLSDDDDAVFPAVLSSNGKYLLMYTDNSTNDSNEKRKKDFAQAVKNFYQ